MVDIWKKNKNKNNLQQMVKDCFPLQSETRISRVALMVKNLPTNAGEAEDKGLISGLERSTGGGHGNPLQYSCLENPMDREVWHAIVHKVTKSQTWLRWLIHTHNQKLANISALTISWSPWWWKREENKIKWFQIWKENNNETAPSANDMFVYVHNPK